MINKINSDKKIDILLSTLGERYQSIHEIRNRVQNIGVWVLGVMLATGVWFFQSTTPLNLHIKEVFILATIVVFLIIRFMYLKNLNVGFCGQQQAAARIEKALGLFTVGVFDESKEAIHDGSWEKAGTEKGEGKFFVTTYILLYVGVTFLILSIMFSGCLSVII